MTLRISGGAGRCHRGIENVLIERREGENLDVLEENLKDILGDLGIKRCRSRRLMKIGNPGKRRYLVKILEERTRKEIKLISVQMINWTCMISIDYSPLKATNHYCMTVISVTKVLYTASLRSGISPRADTGRVAIEVAEIIVDKAVAGIEAGA